MDEIITIDTSGAVIAKPGSDLYTSRENVVNAISDDVTATVSVTAYKRYDKVVRCVESILKNTTDVNYKLILICNGCDDDGKTLDFFKSVNHPKKMIINITKNIGSVFPVNFIERNLEGKYLVTISDDLIVTPRWLSNMIKCAESDIKIGMVNPVASNISNFQQVELEYSDYEEMQAAADKYNQSDPRKWHERIRMVALASLFKRSCLEAIGTTFDTGFFHDFGDDDLSFRIRRAGYKCILAKDTWICHDHDLAYKNEDLAEQSTNAGMMNFIDKYFGLNLWESVNYIEGFIDNLNKTQSKNPNILGIDVGCGAQIVEIQNKLQEFEIFKTNNYGYTEDAKYFIDLQTICGRENVTCDNPGNILNYYDSEMFDYIVIGKEINSYANPFEHIKNIIRLLAKDGQLFVYLKNTYDIFSFLNIIGYDMVHSDKCFYNCSLETFFKRTTQMKLKVKLIFLKKYAPDLIPQNILEDAKNKIKLISGSDSNDIMRRLTINKYAFVITKF